MSEHEASPGISSAPLHRRVRVCRWLWRVLRFVWGTFIIGIIIATIANLNTTTTETPLAKIYIVHLVQTYPIPVWLGLALLAALTLLSWLDSRDQRVTPAPLLSQHDRIYMLRRLHVRYEQILAQSLQGAVQLETIPEWGQTAVFSIVEATPVLEWSPFTPQSSPCLQQYC